MEVKIYAETSWTTPGKSCGIGMWLAEAGEQKAQRRGFVRIIDVTKEQAQLRTLTAALDILIRPCSVQVIMSDPVIGALNAGWPWQWKENGWRKKNGEEVKNSGDWESLLCGLEPHKFAGLHTEDHEKKEAMMLQICDELKKWKGEVMKTAFYVEKEESWKS